MAPPLIDSGGSADVSDVESKHTTLFGDPDLELSMVGPYVSLFMNCENIVFISLISL